jgi:hypothetical protein
VTCDNFRGLEVISGAEALYEKALGFLKEFGDRKSDSEIRDDYQELIELIMIVLVSQPSIYYSLESPAHWMAKLLYAIKIYISRDQRDVFNLTKKEETQILRFVQFGALLYTKAWTKAPLSAE